MKNLYYYVDQTSLTHNILAKTYHSFKLGYKVDSLNSYVVEKMDLIFYRSNDKKLKMDALVNLNEWDDRVVRLHKKLKIREYNFFDFINVVIDNMSIYFVKKTMFYVRESLFYYYLLDMVTDLRML